MCADRRERDGRTTTITGVVVRVAFPAKAARPVMGSLRRQLLRKRCGGDVGDTHAEIRHLRVVVIVIITISYENRWDANEHK